MVSVTATIGSGVGSRHIHRGVHMAWHARRMAWHVCHMPISPVIMSFVIHAAALLLFQCLQNNADDLDASTLNVYSSDLHWRDFR